MACQITTAMNYANSIVSLKARIRSLQKTIETLRARGANTSAYERSLQTTQSQLDAVQSNFSACLASMSWTTSTLNYLKNQIDTVKRVLDSYAARGIGPGNPSYDLYADRFELYTQIYNVCVPQQEPCPSGWTKASGLTCPSGKAKEAHPTRSDCAKCVETPCPSGWMKASGLTCPSGKAKEAHPTRSDCAKCVETPCPPGWTKASELQCVQCVGVTRETHPTRPDCARCVGTCEYEEPCPTGYSPAATLTCSSGQTKVLHPEREDCAKCQENGGTPPQQCPEGWTGTYPNCIDPQGVPRVCDAIWTCWQDPVTQVIRHAPNTCDAENYRKRGYVLVDNKLCFNVPCPSGYEKQADGTCKPIPPKEDIVGAFEWGRWGAWIILGLGAATFFVLYKMGYIKLPKGKGR